MTTTKFNRTNISKIFYEKGYAFFKGIYDLNIIWIRSESSKSNSFDDYCYVGYYDDFIDWQEFILPCTTDPGKTYLINPLNPKGTAILCPTQVRAAHRIGRHQNYTALRQMKPIPYVRDNSLDAKLNFNLYRDCLGNTCVTKDNKNIFWDEVIFANIHRANKWVPSILVDRWSAGCMVLQNPTDFNFIMFLVDQQKKKLGTDFVTFTLLEERDFNF